MNRFEAEVRAKGMSVFAHIDHAAGATAVGLSLRPTELLIFGNAKTGTLLMEFGSDTRHRSATQGLGLAGRVGHRVAVVQRSCVSCAQARHGRRGQHDR